MSREFAALRDAVLLLKTKRTPARIRDFLQIEDRDGLADLWDRCTSDQRAEVTEEASGLAAANVGALTLQSHLYPDRLRFGRKAVAPVIFYRGNLQLLEPRAVGMCGSRHASPLGLKAAYACGHEASRQGLVVVSGYAAGVDSETHLSALRTGGGTIIALPEGIMNFRVKRAFKEVFDEDRALVLSQFAPHQSWAAHAAMARNGIIYGLGDALIVIEAGERGGTLAAGEEALRNGRPVFVLNFGPETPAGNAKLLENGGISVPSREALGDHLTRLRRQGGATQLKLDV